MRLIGKKKQENETDLNPSRFFLFAIHFSGLIPAIASYRKILYGNGLT